MELLIGWATQDITPDKAVELVGQYYQRISNGVRDPLSVTAIASEQRSAGRSEQAVMVSVDAVFVTADFQQEVREAIRAKIADLDPRMVFLNATHIHSGQSWFAPFRWWRPAVQAMQPAEIRSIMLRGVVRAVEEAWNARRSGGVSSASSYARAGFCRRALYADGTAAMYGETNRKDFIGMEAGNDDEVRMLFTWDAKDRLTGVIVNVACPAQVMEAQYVVSADFFGELRSRIRVIYGPQVCVLAQVSAAGDQAPRNLPVQAQDEINYWDESGMMVIARRLEEAVAQGYAAACSRIDHGAVLKHTVDDIALPVRRARQEEYQAACADAKRLTANHRDLSSASRELYSRFVEDVLAGEKRLRRGPFDNKELDFVQLENAQAVIKRFESQHHTPTFPVELHALRLGDCAFVSNPFELYLDYGQMIHARSRAKRTFAVQLACDAGGYLPTARAVTAGGYGSLIINGQVGPEGGHMLVDASVSAINRLWDE